MRSTKLQMLNNTMCNNIFVLVLTKDIASLMYGIYEFILLFLRTFGKLFIKILLTEKK